MYHTVPTPAEKGPAPLSEALLCPSDRAIMRKPHGFTEYVRSVNGLLTEPMSGLNKHVPMGRKLCRYEPYIP
jgi:hypothetical protein